MFTKPLISTSCFLPVGYQWAATTAAISGYPVTFLIPFSLFSNTPPLRHPIRTIPLDVPFTLPHCGEHALNRIFSAFPLLDDRDKFSIF
jgi:hypothetical protein